MTLRKVALLTAVLLPSWLAACGSDFSGSDDAGGSGGRSGANGTGGSGDAGGTNAGKGGKSAGGSSTTGGNVGTSGAIGSAGEGVIGEAGASTGVAGATMGVGGEPAVFPSCRSGALGEVLFCDNFEDPDLPAWSHLNSTGNDGVSHHVTEPVHTGNGAVQSTKSAPGPSDPLVTPFEERAAGQLYARAWMYIPGDVTITAVALANASLLVLGEGPPSDGGVSVSMWADGKSTITVYDPNDLVMNQQAAAYTTPLPRDEWFCLRLDFPIGVNVSSADFHLRINDTVLSNLEADKLVDTTLVGAYARLWVGVNYISPQQLSPVTVYYDDVAVDTQDIACD